MSGSILEQRQREFDKYREAYKVPNYRMRQWRVNRFKDYLKSIQKKGYVSMLDVGCGRGQALDLAKAHGFKAVQGVEVVSYLCKRDDVMLIQGAQELPFETGAFQVVVATDVMEHILLPDVPLVLAEIFRVAAKEVHLTISHKHDAGNLHVCVQPREWWLEKIRQYAPENATITVDSDKMTPHIKLPCSHLQVEWPHA